MDLFFKGPVGGSVIGGLSVVGAFIICQKWSDTSLSTNVSTKKSEYIINQRNF